MRRATSLMPTHESKKFLNLSLIVLSLIKLMMFLYLYEDTDHVNAIFRTGSQAPCRWLLDTRVQTLKYLHVMQYFPTGVPWTHRGPIDSFLGVHDLCMYKMKWQQFSEIRNYPPWCWCTWEKTTNRAEFQDPGFRATQDLAHVNHPMFIHLIKGIQVAIIPPLTMLFSRNSIN